MNSDQPAMVHSIRSGRPPAYQWPDGFRSAACFTVDVDAESAFVWAGRDQPDSNLLAQMEQRQFGPRVGIWRQLDLFARHGIRATFFVPGAVAAAYPFLLPAFVGAGHEVGLHGYHHEHPQQQASHEEFVGALDASLELFRQQVGIVPAGFRSPGFEMTAPMMEELAGRGLYDSSLMGMDHPYQLGRVTEVPVQWTTDDAIHFKFTGAGDRWSPPGPVLDGWRNEWQTLHALGEMFMLTLHDWISSRATIIHMLDQLLATVVAEPDVWIATVGEVAAYHRSSANADVFNHAIRTPPALFGNRFGGA